MKNNSEKIKSIVSEKRVKLHVFKPSQRKIWTVVGKGKEHWLDPEMNFCSCESYYFGKSKGQGICYHLESVTLAKKENKMELVEFADDEFVNFISGLASDF